MLISRLSLSALLCSPGFRPGCFFGCVGVFLVSLCVAAINVFVGADSPLLQFFLYGLLWFTQLLVLAWYLPYDSFKRNVQNVLVAVATLTHSVLFLALQRGGLSSAYLVALLVLFGFVVLVLIFREPLAVHVPWIGVRSRHEKQQAHSSEEGSRLKQRCSHGGMNFNGQYQGTSTAADGMLVSPIQQRAETEEPLGVANLTVPAPALRPDPDQAEADLRKPVQVEHASLRPSHSPESGVHTGPSHSASAFPSTAHSTHRPVSPSLHRRGVSLGPAVRRAELLVDTNGSEGCGAASARGSSHSVSGGAVQLAVSRPSLLSHNNDPSDSQLISNASSHGQQPVAHLPGGHGSLFSRAPFPPVPLVSRLLPPLSSRPLVPRSPLVSACPVDLEHVLSEHDRNQIKMAYAYEMEGHQQLQRARRIKEERRKQKMERENNDKKRE
jgi:hypothetical protein